MVQEGDRLSVRAPAGHFYLEPDDPPVVLIAGGIGITPLLSMLNASLLAGEGRQIWLFYGVRNSAEHAMKAHLEKLAREHANFHLHVCHAEPLPTDRQGTDHQHAGLIDITLLRLTLPLKPLQFYVCGPRPMMEAIIPALEDWGVPHSDIHYESFGPATLTRTERPDAGADDTSRLAETATVTFSQSGRTFVWDGSAESLLAFAECNGIDVESGCRAGSCGTCQTAIEQGTVHYDQRPDFMPMPGHCLLCIARPASDLVLTA
jgi:ferredoxin-NADP reductase